MGKATDSFGALSYATLWIHPLFRALYQTQPCPLKILRQIMDRIILSLWKRMKEKWSEACFSPYTCLSLCMQANEYVSYWFIMVESFVLYFWEKLANLDVLQQHSFSLSCHAIKLIIIILYNLSYSWAYCKDYRECLWTV